MDRLSGNSLCMYVFIHMDNVRHVGCIDAVQYWSTCMLKYSLINSITEFDSIEDW